MTQGKLLKEAVITDSAVTYQVLAICLVFAATIIGIPLLLIVWPAATWYWRLYYRNLRVSLTTRELKVHRGILVREEKSIPLEKITDLAVYQGPVMRWLGLKGIRVETAGQSSGTAALVSIVGIDDTDDFRDRVLAQRDRITDRDPGSATLPAATPQADPAADPAATAAAAAALLELTTEIRDSLQRIEAALHRD